MFAPSMDHSFIRVSCFTLQVNKCAHSLDIIFSTIHTLLIHPRAMIDNGFFAAWLGCLSAFSLLLTEMRDESPEHS